MTDAGHLRRAIAVAGVLVTAVYLLFMTWLAVASVDRSTGDTGVVFLLLSSMTPVILSFGVAGFLYFVISLAGANILPAQGRYLPGALYLFALLSLVVWILISNRTFLYAVDLFPVGSEIQDAASIFVASFPSASMSAFLGALLVGVPIVLFCYGQRWGVPLLVNAVVAAYGVWELVSLGGKL